MRVGFVGFGSIAEHGHLPAWWGFPGVEVVAVADPSPERRGAAQEQAPRARLYEAPLDLIRDENLDALDICSPPGTHADLLVAACRRNIPTVVCEKPFVLSPGQFARVAEVREQSGSRVVSVNNWMYSDLFWLVRQTLDRREIGEVREVVLRTARPDCALGNGGWLPRWRTDRVHAGGGIVLDHGWHQLYLVLRWVGQPVQWVQAAMRTVDHRHHPVEDEAELRLVFASCEARIELSWTARDRANDGCIRGTRGQIEIQDGGIIVRGNATRHADFRGRLTLSSYHPEWFEEMLRCNVFAHSRAEADRNFAEAGDVVAIIDAAYRSAARNGQPCIPGTPGSTVDEVDSPDVRGSGVHPAERQHH